MRLGPPSATPSRGAGAITISCSTQPRHDLHDTSQIWKIKVIAVSVTAAWTALPGYETGGESELGRFSVTVTTDWAVLPTYSARMGSELAGHSSDVGSLTRLSAPLGEYPNENLQIDLLVQSEGRLSSMDSTLSGSWSVAFALDSEARRLVGPNVETDSISVIGP
jgi:hypothetical protein